MFGCHSYNLSEVVAKRRYWACVKKCPVQLRYYVHLFINDFGTLPEAYLEFVRSCTKKGTLTRDKEMSSSVEVLCQFIYKRFRNSSRGIFRVCPQLYQKGGNYPELFESVTSGLRSS